MYAKVGITSEHNSWRAREVLHEQAAHYRSKHLLSRRTKTYRQMSVSSVPLSLKEGQLYPYQLVSSENAPKCHFCCDTSLGNCKWDKIQNLLQLLKLHKNMYKEYVRCLKRETHLKARKLQSIEIMDIDVKVHAEHFALLQKAAAASSIMTINDVVNLTVSLISVLTILKLIH